MFKDLRSYIRHFCKNEDLLTFLFENRNRNIHLDEIDESFISGLERLREVGVIRVFEDDVYLDSVIKELFENSIHTNRNFTFSVLANKLADIDKNINQYRDNNENTKYLMNISFGFRDVSDILMDNAVAFTQKKSSDFNIAIDLKTKIIELKALKTELDSFLEMRDGVKKNLSKNKIFFDSLLDKDAKLKLLGLKRTLQNIDESIKTDLYDIGRNLAKYTNESNRDFILQLFKLEDLRRKGELESETNYKDIAKEYTLPSNINIEVNLDSAYQYNEDYEGYVSELLSVTPSLEKVKSISKKHLKKRTKDKIITYVIPYVSLNKQFLGQSNSLSSFLLSNGLDTKTDNNWLWLEVFAEMVNKFHDDYIIYKSYEQIEKYDKKVVKIYPKRSRYEVRD